MPRPKKTRHFDGHQLPENLYPDPARRPNKWKYIRADGTSQTFTSTTKKAIENAVEANLYRNEETPRKTAIPSKHTLAYHAEEFFTDRESTDEKLTGDSKSWRDRKNYIRKFVVDIGVTLPHQLEHQEIQEWWKSLSYHGQHNRRPELMKFINYLMLGDMVPNLRFNPFGKDTSQPHLIKKSKPKKKRIRLDIESYWAIYRLAGEKGYAFLQIAMGVSLLTTMRRDDICKTRFDDIDDNVLKKVITKSLNQRGPENADYLEWDLGQFPLLRSVIQRARELSLVNARCPYMISHKMRRRYKSNYRSHGYQVLPDYLSRAFSEIRDQAGLYDNLDDQFAPPTFHEVRALASNQFDQAGYDLGQVQQLMAHTDEKITKEVYQSGHQVVYTKIDLILTPENIGGSF